MLNKHLERPNKLRLKLPGKKSKLKVSQKSKLPRRKQMLSELRLRLPNKRSKDLMMKEEILLLPNSKKR